MIRNACAQDVDFFYDLYMHPRVNPFLLYEMTDKAAFQPIFDELLQQAVLYIYSVNEHDVGMFKLIPLKHRNTHVAYLGGLAIDPSHAGKSYGLSMLKEILAFAATQDFLRVELSVAVQNQKAIQLYEKVGFQQEGVLRKLTYLKSEERYIDEVMMSYLT